MIRRGVEDLLAAWEPNGWQIDWGSAPVWASLLAAIVAGAVALWNARTARQALAIATEKQDQDRADRQRAQAELVAAWVSADVLTDEMDMPYWHYGLEVPNASQLPVYDVRCAVQIDGVTTVHRQAFTLVAPSQQPMARDLPVDAANLIRHLGRKSENAPSIGVDIEFTDASGRTWLRKASGPLLQVPPPPRPFDVRPRRRLRRRRLRVGRVDVLPGD